MEPMVVFFLRLLEGQVCLQDEKVIQKDFTNAAMMNRFSNRIGIIDTDGELIEVIQHKELSPEAIESNNRILDLINAQAEWEDTEWLPDDFKR